MVEKVKKTEAEWKAQLTPEQFRVTRKHGTERAFTGKYHDKKNRESITVSVVGLNCSMLSKSMTLEPVGLAFGNLCTQMLLLKRLTLVCS